jgi:diaminopimelate decarboxylase
MLNEALQYRNGVLHSDAVPLTTIAAQVGTPTYIYSLPRVRHNYRTLAAAFSRLDAHLHYSVKANANLALLRALLAEGAGFDAVSGGEIHRALTAGAAPADIVFAGVGKTPEELRYAVAQGVGWFNVENVDECRILNSIAAEHNTTARVALRYNPDVQANTHPNIATGHKGAKFGLNADDLRYLLDHATDYPHLSIEGIHVHVGSQLGDTHATRSGVQAALDLIAGHTNITTINIGGGFPVAYTDDPLPDVTTFAATVAPLLDGYHVLVEPGRSIVADAGLLLTRLLYQKEQGGETLYIVDASMTELMRPALYNAHHGVVPVQQAPANQTVTVVGPVCETTDVLRHDAALPALQHGDLLALTDVGAYGMVMANTYNQRPRPAEVVTDGDTWTISRQRETYADLLRHEQG